MTKEEYKKYMKTKTVWDTILYMACCLSTGLFLGESIKHPNFPNILITTLSALMAIESNKWFRADLHKFFRVKDSIKNSAQKSIQR